eukprot:17322-Heterococcus_DN1.PRE.1
MFWLYARGAHAAVAGTSTLAWRRCAASDTRFSASVGSSVLSAPSSMPLEGACAMSSGVMQQQHDFWQSVSELTAVGAAVISTPIPPPPSVGACAVVRSTVQNGDSISNYRMKDCFAADMLHCMLRGTISVNCSCE